MKKKKRAEDLKIHVVIAYMRDHEKAAFIHAAATLGESHAHVARRMIIKWLVNNDYLLDDPEAVALAKYM